MPQKKYEETPALINKLQRLSARHSTVRDLAKAAELPYHFVYKMVRKLDLQLLNKNSEIIDRVLEEKAKNPNLKTSDLAPMLGIKYHTLHSTLRRHGELPGGRLPGSRCQRSEQLAEQIKQLATRGLTQTQIARELGITKQYVHLLRTQHHIEVTIMNNKSELRKKQREVTQLLKDGFTPYRIHIMTGFSKNFVYKIANQAKES